MGVGYVLNIRKLSFEEKLVFITAVSIMLPFYIGAAALIFNFIYILKSKKLDSLIVGSKENRWLMGFILYSIVVCFFYKNGLGVLATLGMLIFFIYFIYNTRYLKEELVEKILTALIFLSALWFLNTILRASYIFFLSNEGMDGFLRFISMNRADSVFFNPNYYGMVGDFMFLIGLDRYMKEKGSQKLIYGMYLLIAAIAVFLSGSRGAQIALIFGALYLSVHKRDFETTKILAFAILIALGLVIITGNMAYTRIATITQDMGLRKSIWGSAIRFINKNMLIGAGPLGMHAVYDLIKSREVIHSHNLVLDFLVNFGFIGLLMIYPLFQGIYYRLSTFKNSKLYGLIVAMTIVILVHGMVDVTIFWHQTAFIYFMLVFSVVGSSEELEFTTIVSPNAEDIPRKALRYNNNYIK